MHRRRWKVLARALRSALESDTSSAPLPQVPILLDKPAAPAQSLDSPRSWEQ